MNSQDKNKTTTILNLVIYRCFRFCSMFFFYTYWTYRAGGGSANMGDFRISCQLANDLAIAYGLGKPESTPIYFSYEEAGGSSRTLNIPILSITGGKIDKWMSFTRRFQPTR